MYARLATTRLRQLAGQFPAVLILGARQVGKTTLARPTFPDLPYCDLEDPATQALFAEDPRFQLEARARPGMASNAPAPRAAEAPARHGREAARHAQELYELGRYEESARSYLEALSGSSLRLANLFQGQTSWQSSQPKMRLPISGRSASSMLPSCSMVR